MTLLKLDVDRPVAPRLVPLVAKLRTLGLTAQRPVVYRRTRKGWHVLIPVRERLDAVTTVAVQAVLGSDRHRETFNLVRARSWPAGFHRYGNVLFSRKVAS